MHKTLNKTHRLDVDDFLARRLHIAVLWNERLWIDITLENKVALASRMHVNKTNVGAYHATLSIGVSGICTTIATQTLYVNLSGDKLIFHCETLSLSKQRTILVNESMTTINKVLSTLTESCRSINVACNGTSTLLFQEAHKIVALTNKFVACREVEDDISSCESKMITWRSWSPNILANLDTKLHAI